MPPWRGPRCGKTKRGTGHNRGPVGCGSLDGRTPSRARRFAATVDVGWWRCPTTTTNTATTAGTRARPATSRRPPTCPHLRPPFPPRRSRSPAIRRPHPPGSGRSHLRHRPRLRLHLRGCSRPPIRPGTPRPPGQRRRTRRRPPGSRRPLRRRRGTRRSDRHRAPRSSAPRACRTVPATRRRRLGPVGASSRPSSWWWWCPWWPLASAWP